MQFNKEKYCQEQYGVKSDKFVYEDETFIVNYTMTYNANIGNKGTPFIVGDLLENPTKHLKAKSFLIKEWL